MNKISVITVNWNNAEGLEKTIKSVIDQTLLPFEYIIIDGASTDESVSVIEKYSEYISYWVSEKDSGVFNAMNKGIAQAKGDYCHFLNSGDIFASKDVLSHVFGSKEYTVPFINGHQINDYVTEQHRISASNRFLTLYDFYRGTIKHQATFMRRDLFDTYGLYDESLKIVADWKFFLQTIGLHNEQPVYVDEDIVIFEWSGLSTNVQLAEKHQAERQKVLDECIPKSVQADYEHLQHLTNYEYLATAMEKSKLLRVLVNGLTKLFSVLGIIR